MEKWLVLYTRSRHEKKIAQKLGQEGFEVYCPTVTILRQWSDRKKKVEVPLFKSYFFIRIEESRRQEVFQFPGLVRYLYLAGQPAVVRPAEIKAIKDFINDYDGRATLSLTEGFSPGQAVEITEGILAGHQGEVLRIKKGNQVIIRVESLRLSVIAELYEGQLRER